MEESHTKEQSPKQFCERCFEQGDRKSQQNELELVLELVGDFFGRKKKCVVVGISGGEPPWAHEAGGRAQGGRARPPPSWPGACPSCCVLSARYSQIFQKKSYSIFRAFGELLFSRYFYIARINQKTDRKKYYFLLYFN